MLDFTLLPDGMFHDDAITKCTLIFSVTAVVYKLAVASHFHQRKKKNTKKATASFRSKETDWSGSTATG